jgi:beta-xylosidase
VFVGYWQNPSLGDDTGDNRTVTVQIRYTAGAAPSNTSVTLWWIDRFHSNPLAAWKAMGSPAVPSNTQLEELKQVSELAPETTQATVVSNTLMEVQLTMTPNSAVAMVFGN